MNLQSVLMGIAFAGMVMTGPIVFKTVWFGQRRSAFAGSALFSVHLFSFGVLLRDDPMINSEWLAVSVVSVAVLGVLFVWIALRDAYLENERLKAMRSAIWRP